MAEHIMNGAELASMLKGQLKSSVHFNGIEGVDDESLHLSEADIKWWRDAKFGLFIHWGIYSVIGKGEWAYFNEKIEENDYRKIAEEFCPSRSAEEIVGEWVENALDAGMKYAVMVTRHHDGYALWDSKYSWKEFTSAKCGPKKDYVKAFANACHKNNLYTGLYYSPMDWRFPGYFDPKGQPENAALMKEQAYGQIEELCTEFGKVDIIWYDGGWLAHEGNDADAAWFWEPIKLNKMVRSHNPKMMVTPRSGYRGDFECDEGAHEVTGKIVTIPWEKNMSLSSAWGYRPNDKFHPLADMIRMLVNVICRDGNLLLNVGPDPDGHIPQEAKKVLKGMGDWLRKNGEAVYGTRGGIWQPVDHVYGSTCKGEFVYLHVLDCEEFAKQILPFQNFKVEKAELLNGKEISFSITDSGIKISIPEEIVQEKRIDTIIRIRLQKNIS